MDTVADPRAEIEETFASLVEDAHKEYLATADDAQKDFQSLPITSANALLRLIRDQNEQFSNFRSRERRLLDIVGSLIKPIEIIGGVAAGATEEIFPPAQHIFSAVMFLVGAANDVSEIYDAIIDLFTRLQVSFHTQVPLVRTSGGCRCRGPTGMLTSTAGFHDPLGVLHQGGNVTTAAREGRADPRRALRNPADRHRGDQPRPGQGVLPQGLP